MKATPEMVRALLRASPFQDVSDAELQPLLPSFHHHHCEAGRFVWRQGDAAADLWFVLEGQVQAVQTNINGAQIVTGVVGPGESFGHPALFAARPQRIVSIVALVPTDLARLPREPLLDFLEKHPAAMRRMLESMSTLMLSLSSLFTQVAFHDVRGRIAFQLLKLADEYGQPVEDGLRIPFRLSQTTLAGLVASSRESTNRALNAFVASGHIRQDSGYIVVVNRHKLREAFSSTALG